MSEEEFKRRLTAILSYDVKGYSGLMGEDERTRVENLKCIGTAWILPKNYHIKEGKNGMENQSN